MKDYINKLYSFIIITLSCMSFIASGTYIVLSITNQTNNTWQAIGCMVIGMATTLFYIYMNRLASGEEK